MSRPVIMFVQPGVPEPPAGIPDGGGYSVKTTLLYIDLFCVFKANLTNLTCVEKCT